MSDVKHVTAGHCERCTNKICIIKGRPCGKVEDYLREQKRKEGYSNSYIRRMESPHSEEYIELRAMEAIRRRKGTKR